MESEWERGISGTKFGMPLQKVQDQPGLAERAPSKCSEHCLPVVAAGLKMTLLEASLFEANQVNNMTTPFEGRGS